MSKWYKRDSLHEMTPEHMATCWNPWCRERLRLQMLRAAAPSRHFAGRRALRESAELCWYCGCVMDDESRSLRRRSIDHVIPQSRGGGNNFENLVVACQWCNGDKGAQTLAEYRNSVALRLGVPVASIEFYGELAERTA